MDSVILVLCPIYPFVCVQLLRHMECSTDQKKRENSGTRRNTKRILNVKKMQNAQGKKKIHASLAFKILKDRSAFLIR